MSRNFNRIAMLSTHGYFDPVPVLGRTDTGGQVVYVLELAKAIASQGIKVDIFTRWFDKSQAQIDPLPGHEDVRVIRIHAGPWEFIPKERIYDVLDELSANMLQFIQENDLDYDLYHGHYVDAGMVTLKVANTLMRPSFFTAHSLGAWKKDQMGGDPEEMEKKFNFKLRIAEELEIFRNVNAQTLTSVVQLEKLNELYDFYADNIEIIPPGVNIHQYRLPTEDDLSRHADLPDNYIFCLSRIDSNKGHDLLLHAFDLVRKEIDDITLVIGGGSPNPKPREKEVFAGMHRIIEEKKLHDHVHFTGYIPDDMVVPYYQKAEMFVLPSLFEPFGMTSQEAMACGQPVVASKFGGIRNTIIDGKDGLLVNPQDPREFADAMIKLLRDKDYKEKLSKAAYRKIQEEYSWEAIASRFLSFFTKYI
jgi:mannosylfructose-phosphate synthase